MSRRFSIRTLLILIFVFAAIFAWQTSHTRRIKRAILTLERSGISYTTLYESLNWYNKIPFFRSPPSIERISFREHKIEQGKIEKVMPALEGIDIDVLELGIGYPGDILTVERIEKLATLGSVREIKFDHEIDAERVQHFKDSRAWRWLAVGDPQAE